MPAPQTVDEFLELVRKSGLVDPGILEPALQKLREQGSLPPEPKKLAVQLVRDGVLTLFHAEQMLRGIWRGFNLGRYKILERLGSGGMAIVYLGEHKLMGHRVAIKVLPVGLAEQRWFLDRFYQEARAVAALNHPNIVKAYDIDQEGNLHFIVMEYVEGSSLQDIVGKRGPMDHLRAAHYIRQAAQGLAHIHEVGLVHRDLKPANLLLDKYGTVKILDLGLARFFQDHIDSIPGKKGRVMVGTDDYLAPEQIVNSDDVDIRADIYSLGATFYFLLTGCSPFEDVSMAYQKLLRHLAQRPKTVREVRPEVPEELAQIVDKMMAKNPWERHQTPAQVVEVLAPFTDKPIPPPPAKEMPRLCPAIKRPSSVVHGSAVGDRSGTGSSVRPGSGYSASSLYELLPSSPSNAETQTPIAAASETKPSGAQIAEVVPPTPAEAPPKQENPV